MMGYEIKVQAIHSAEEYIKKLMLSINIIVENFQGGNEHIATNQMIKFIDGMQWLLEVLNKTRDIHGNYKIEFTDIVNILNEMIEAYENSDYVLMSDLLEYEVHPMLKEWSEKLEHIKEGI